MTSSAWVAADWPAPAPVHAGCTTRTGGVSGGAFASLDLAAHVGDDPAAVAENRVRLRRMLGLPAEPRWLRQVHGATVVHFDAASADEPAVADAAITRTPGVVLAVLTADCLPVLLAARDGSIVGVAHAGWRGLAAGVIEAAIRALAVPGRDLLAWLGPAIGPRHYEVGGDVHAAFAGSPGAEEAFAPSGHDGHWRCDLAALACARLAAAGVPDIAGDGRDTFAEPDHFYSFRRDNETGRMASLIWLAGR